MVPVATKFMSAAYVALNGQGTARHLVCNILTIASSAGHVNLKNQQIQVFQWA